MQNQSLKDFESLKQSLACDLADLSSIIRKYDEVIGGNTKIKFDEKYESHKTLDEIILEQRETMLKGNFKILVLGEFSTGKSTFLNALLGEKILPVAVKPTTAAINIITYSNEKRVLIENWGKFDETGHEVTNGEKYEITIEQLKEYTTSLTPKANEIAKKIKIAEVFFPSEYCKSGVEIIDTPGLASINEHHDRITLNYLPKGNACIMLLNPTQPLTKSERNYLRIIRRHISKVIFVVNKINLLDKDDAEEALDYISIELKKELQTDTEIILYPINAKLAQEGDWDTSNFKNCISDLEKFLISDEKAYAMIIPPAVNAINNIKNIKCNIKTIIEGANFSPEEFDNKIKEIQPKLLRIKKRREDLLQFIKDKQSILINTINTEQQQILNSERSEITEFIMSWEKDVDALKEILPYYLKERIINVSQNIEENIVSDIEIIQKEVMSRLKDFMEDIKDYQESLSFSINIKKMKAISLDTDYSFADIGILFGGGLGAGAVAAMLLAGPIGWIAAIGGSMLWGVFYGENKKQKALTGISNEVNHKIETEFNNAIKQINNSVTNLLAKFKSSIDKEMLNMLKSLDDVIINIKNQKKLKEHEMQEKIRVYTSLESEFSNIENSLNNSIKSMS